MRAIWIVSILCWLTIIGFGVYNYNDIPLFNKDIVSEKPIKKVVVKKSVVKTETGKRASNENSMRPVTFTIKSTKDLIVFNSEVNSEMKDKFVKKITGSSADEMFIYINSPGGSVFHMATIIETMQASGKKFTCYAKQAASAAFTIFQLCDKRYMSRISSILMQHNARGSFGGDFETMKKKVTMWDSIIRSIELMVSSKMNMSLKDYKILIANEVWMDYPIAKSYSAVDSYAYIRCSKKLIDKVVVEKKKFCSIFGCVKVKITRSECPLISGKTEVVR